MFADTKDGSKSGLDKNDTEEDYFEIMKNMNDDKRKVQLTVIKIMYINLNEWMVVDIDD